MRTGFQWVVPGVCLSSWLVLGSACAGHAVPSPPPRQGAAAPSPEGAPTPIIQNALSAVSYLLWSGDGEALVFASGGHVMRMHLESAEVRVCECDSRLNPGITSLRTSEDGEYTIAGLRGGSSGVICDPDGQCEVSVPGYYDGTGEDTDVGISRDGVLVETRARVRLLIPGMRDELEELLDQIEGPYRICGEGDVLFANIEGRPSAILIAAVSPTPLEGLERMPSELECTPDARYAVASDGRAWSIVTGDRVSFTSTPAVTAVRSGPEDGEVMLVSSGIVRVVSVPENRVLREVAVTGPYAIASEGRVATANGASVRVEVGGEAREFGFGSTVRYLAWHPTADVLAVAVEGSGIFLIRADGMRARVGVVTTEQGQRFVLVDDEGHFDGPEEALSVLQVRFGEDGPTRSASEVDPRWRAPIRSTLMRR